MREREREMTGRRGHYKDTIVGAVSKGDLSKELWCAAISPTSVRTLQPVQMPAIGRGWGE